MEKIPEIDSFTWKEIFKILNELETLTGASPSLMIDKDVVIVVQSFIKPDRGLPVELFARRQKEAEILVQEILQRYFFPGKAKRLSIEQNGRILVEFSINPCVP